MIPSVTSVTLKKRTMQPVQTLEDFILQWDKKLDKIIRSFKLQEFTEDLKQEIYLRIFDNDGLAKYNPTISSFSTYIYAVILTIVLNFRKQYFRERNTMPVSFDACNLDDSSRQDSPERGKLSSAQIASMRVDEERTRDFWLQISSVKKALSKMPVRSVFYRNGELTPRDLSSLFDMIMEGKSRDEMCDYFSYSSGSVGILFDELRQVPEIVELRELLL